MKKNGFSLIELMVTIIVLAVLAIAASIGYQSTLQNSRQQQAISTMMKDSQFMEKFYMESNSYALINGTQISWPSLPYPISPESTGSSTDANVLYYISFSSTTASESDYTLIAQPKCGTTQASQGCICLTRDNNVFTKTNITCQINSTLCACK